MRTLRAIAVLVCLAAGPAWPQTPPSDQRAQAAALMAQANALATPHTPDGLHRALALYEQAMPTWQALGDASWQVQTLIAEASAHFFLGEATESTTLLERAASVAATSADRGDLAAVRAAEANLHAARGEFAQAHQSAAAAAAIVHALGQKAAEANMRFTLGSIDMGQSNPAEAVGDYEQAAALYHALGNQRGQALALAGAGRAANLLNQPSGWQTAVADYAAAIPLLDPATDSFNLASALWGLGMANDRLGQKETARDAYRRALPLFAAPNFRQVRARILLSLAEDEQALHDDAGARDYFEQALPLFVSPADDLSRGLALMGLGAVRENLGDSSGALIAYTDAEAAWHTAQDPAAEATAALKIGGLDAAAKDWAGALDAYNTAARLDAAAGDLGSQATALAAIAGTYQAQGDARHMLDTAERALPLVADARFATQRSVLLQMAGLAASDLHQNAKALAYLDQAIALGEQNPTGKAGALTAEAGIYTAMGDPVRALGLLNQARAIHAALGNQAMLDKVANDIGLAYAALGRGAEAVAMFEQSLAAARASGNAQQQAAILGNLAQVRLAFGDTAQAVELFQQALDASVRAGDRNTEAITLSNLGMAYHAAGDEAQAETTLLRALKLHRDLGDPHGAAIVLNNLALFYDDTGDPQKALDTYSQARQSFGSDADPENEAAALGNIGKVYRGLGADDRARSYYQQALAIYDRTGDDEGRATTLNNQAVLWQSDGDPLMALELYGQALPIVEKLGERPRQAQILSAMGVAQSQRDDHAAALDALDRAQAIAQDSGDPSVIALTLHNLGTEYEKTGDLAQALRFMRQALTLWRQTRDVDAEATAMTVIARIELAQGAVDDALRDADVAIGLRESLRGRVASDELRASLLARATGAYAVKIEALMRANQSHPGQQYDARALEVSERARARSLLDLLAESHAAITRGVDPQSLKDQQAIGQELNAKASQRAKLPPDTPQAEQLDQEINELIAAYERRQSAIRAASPSYAALTQPQPLSLAQIQHLLDPDTLLLEYAVGQDRGYVWAVTPTTLHAYALPPRATIEAAERDFRDAMMQVANPRAIERESSRLGAMLLRPVAAELGHKRLVVVGDAGLQAAVPFAALAAPGSPSGQFRPLILDHEIMQEPSASAVAALRDAPPRPRPSGIVAVLADPVVSADDPRLPADRRGPAGPLARLQNTLAEAAAILALAPPSRTLARFGFDASKPAAENPDLAGYRIVHFATHGLLDQRNPELSGLIFSLFRPDGSQADGTVRLTDVFNLSLPVDLVVLSACESGQGKAVGGEGLVGLTRGFFYAGAPRLVVSLWKVDDAATAGLMKAFYRGMLSHEALRPAAALRQAQIAMIAGGRWRHPYYWAPFIAQGEWRP